jgi:uncharacterized membrane protein
MMCVVQALEENFGEDTRLMCTHDDNVGKWFGWDILICKRTLVLRCNKESRDRQG